MGNILEVSFFWNVLPYEPVRVFDGFFLPGTIGSRKILYGSSPDGFGYVPVCAELAPVVRRLLVLTLCVLMAVAAYWRKKIKIGDSIYT